MVIALRKITDIIQTQLNKSCYTNHKIDTSFLHFLYSKNTISSIKLAIKSKMHSHGRGSPCTARALIIDHPLNCPYPDYNYVSLYYLRLCFQRFAIIPCIKRLANMDNHISYAMVLCTSYP